MYIFNNLTN